MSPNKEQSDLRAIGNLRIPSTDQYRLTWNGKDKSAKNEYTQSQRATTVE